MKNLFLPILIAFLLTSLFTTRAQESIKLELSVEKTNFLLGEPVVVLVKLTNTGPVTITIPSGLEPEMDVLHYEIINPKGKTSQFSPLFVMDTDWLITLNKNESTYGSARLFFGGEGYYFPEPGVYRVKVRYKSFQSNSLQVNVLKPKDDSERLQARLILDNNEVGLFLMLEGGDELQEAQKVLRILEQRYPKSLLTAYVRFAQGKNLSVPARNFVTKKPRGADFTRAIEILESIKDMNVLMYYRVKTAATLSKCYQKTGRTEDARKVLEEVRQQLNKLKRLTPYFTKEIDAAFQKMQ